MEVQNEAQLMGLGDTVGDDVEAADDEDDELGSSDEDDEGHEDYEGYMRATWRSCMICLVEM